VRTRKRLYPVWSSADKATQPQLALAGTGKKGAIRAQATAMAMHMIVIDQSRSPPRRRRAFQLAWRTAATRTIRLIQMDMRVLG
jgi:hypothetical protein